MKKGKMFVILFFVFCFSFIGNVKADKYDTIFKCNGANVYCAVSVIDGKLTGTQSGCDFYDGNQGVNAKLYFDSSDVNIPESSKCYKVSYVCQRDNSNSQKYYIRKMKLEKSNATSNDASNNIICPIVSVCDGINEENFSQKCSNKSADFTTFSTKCDLAPTDAMNYCNGKGDYSESSDNTEYIDDIRGGVNNSNTYDLDNTTTCTSLLGTGKESLGQILKDVFLILCAIGVVVLVFTVSSDFIKAITNSDNDGLSSAFKSAKTRIIATIILLILPVVINFAVDIINNNAIIITDSDGNHEVRIGSVSECNIAN